MLMTEEIFQKYLDHLQGDKLLSQQQIKGVTREITFTQEKLKDFQLLKAKQKSKLETLSQKIK